MSMQLEVLPGANIVGNEVAVALLLKPFKGTTTLLTCIAPGGMLERNRRIRS